MRPIVIALGGNALLRRGERPTFEAQRRNAALAVRSIAPAFADRRTGIVITHGNGPQVGEELLRGEFAKRRVPRLPLHAMNAETQALIGTMIQGSVMGELARMRSNREACTVLTHVLVDRRSDAFRKPTKPIGPFYSKRELDAELRLERFDYVKEPGGFRRVVASPRPLRILEEAVIEGLVKGGAIVVACGGGGVPVAKGGTGYVGVPAVLDKDRTTQLLASTIGAERMVMLTDVDGVYRDYAHRKGLIRRARAKEISGMIGSLDEGTMKPKVQAAVDFVARGGSAAYIGHLDRFESILHGSSGTKIF